MSEQKFNRYRIKVDEDLIDSFFAHPVKEATEAELAEVNKVITIVLKLYYSKYYQWYDDLRAWVLTAIFERHKNYDPQWRSFNYVYRIARNEAGNKIQRFNKEAQEFVDYLPEPNERTTFETDLLGEVRPILPYLSGQVSFTIVDVPKRCIFPLYRLVLEQQKEAARNDFKTKIIETLISTNYE